LANNSPVSHKFSKKIGEQLAKKYGKRREESGFGSLPRFSLSLKFRAFQGRDLPGEKKAFGLREESMADKKKTEAKGLTLEQKQAEFKRIRSM
jgi:hypothetical protein